MENFFFGFYLGISLILALGPQNLFVIEQGLKRNYIFLVCLICFISDFIFIVIGTASFHFFSKSFPIVDLILNLLLLAFIISFIWNKLKNSSDLQALNQECSKDSMRKVFLKTLAFTYLNPHVYSDTIFILGGFSSEFLLNDKISFVSGAASASFIYFFSLGYASSYFVTLIKNKKIWRLLNRTIIFTMSLLAIYIFNKITQTIVSMI